MLVIFFVAGITGQRGMAVLDARQMAVCAFDFEMPAFKCEIRESMVKQFLIEIRDLRPAALVFGMTCVACAQLDFFSVKSLFLFDVQSYIFVTGLA